MTHTNRILFKFTDVGMPDIITTNDQIRISSISIDKSENKTVENDALFIEEKGVQKD